MNRIETIELRSSLTSKELRAKHLSGNDLVSLSYLKKEMASYFETMADAEQEAAKAEGVKQDAQGNFIIGDNTGFEKKLKEIQKVPFESKNLNFIDSETIAKFVSDTDVNTALVIIEHLGKKPTE
jgi:hypothetical protein